MRSLWMLVSAFFFSLMAAFTKLGAKEFGPFELVFSRQIFATPVIYVGVALTGHTVRTPYLAGNIKRSIFGTIALLIWVYALGALPLGKAMTLNYTSPLFMAAIATWLAVRAKQHVEGKLLMCVLAGFIGILFVLKPDVGAEDVLAGFIGIWSGFFAALAHFKVRQLTAIHEHEWRIVCYFSLVGTIAALVGHFAYEGQLTPITSTNIWALLGIAVSGVLAQLSLTRAWGGGNLLLTSSLQFSAIVFAAIIGFFVFDEPISVFSGLGIALIVGSGLTATLETKRKLRTSIPQKSSVKSSTKG